MVRAKGKAGWLGLLLATLLLGAAPAGAANLQVADGVEADIYGFLRLDAAWADSALTPGNWAVNALSETLQKTDSQFNMSVNTSRFGLAFSGPEISGGKMGGKLEFDFTNANAGDNKGVPILRLAYLNMNWDSGLSVLIGQTWDLMAVNFPNTVNFNPLWYAGNYGYRRSMVMIGQKMGLGEGSSLEANLALCRNVGQTIASITDVGDTGTDAAVPVVEGKVTLKTPLLSAAPAMLALSGHWGKEEYALGAPHCDCTVYPTYSMRVDLTLPVMNGLEIKGAAFDGVNMGNYVAGIGGSINKTTEQSIRTKGAWANIQIGPFDGMSFNIGGGLEVPEYAQIATAAKQQNSAVYGNVWLPLAANTKLGVEVSQWNTQYKEAADGDALQVLTAFVYSY